MLLPDKKTSIYYTGAFGTNYSRIDQGKFFKGCLPQISLGPFLNILSHLELCQTSMMEFFSEILEWLLTSQYFHREVPSEMF